MLLESVTNEDLSIIREIISLAVGREGKTQDDSRTIFEVSRGATDQLRLLRACAATVSDRSNLRIKSPYEHYRNLLGEMDERWPEASWPTKCIRLEMMMNGENDQSNVHERSQQYATDHTSATYIGAPWSSYSILETSQPHHSHHHHCGHQYSCHPLASTSALLNHRSLHNMASHATDTTLRPPTPIANLSSIHPADVTSKNPVLQDLHTQASTNEQFNQGDLDLPVRRTVVKVFFTWLRHVRKLRQQKARLVTQWVIAAKRDQTNVISKHFRCWLLATRNRKVSVCMFSRSRDVVAYADEHLGDRLKRDTQLMSMKKVLHAFRVNVVYVRRALDEFQRAHVMKTHFVLWSSKARQLKRQRRDLIINESVVRRVHERHLASATFRVRASEDYQARFLRNQPPALYSNGE
ncbi:hypothetical protein HDU85_001331 [Gaertneriomyces sp. JEL0708]|nr:hypothetical protein HDU85_001331 [Gaertneriomyces sp. JEL0708]